MPQLHLTLFNSLEYFSWNNGLFVVRFSKQRSLFSHIRKLVFIWILMIYFKMCTDSKQDDIKCEYVIFTHACLRSTIMSMWVFPPVKFGVGGGGQRFEKLCVPLEKSCLRPCIVLYSSPVSTFIPSKSQQTEKSGKGFEFSLKENVGLNLWNNGMFMKITRKSKLRLPYRKFK